MLLWLKNRTRNAVFSKRVTVASPDLTSAEWIAEAPSECSSNGYCRQIPLADFGSVTFTKVAALASISGLGDQGGTISSTLWQSTPVQLVPRPSQRFFGDVGRASRRHHGHRGRDAVGPRDRRRLVQRQLGRERKRVGVSRVRLRLVARERPWRARAAGRRVGSRLTGAACGGRREGVAGGQARGALGRAASRSTKR